MKDASDSGNKTHIFMPRHPSRSNTESLHLSRSFLFDIDFISWEPVSWQWQASFPFSLDPGLRKVLVSERLRIHDRD